jgi:hypothetical protein
MSFVKVVMQFRRLITADAWVQSQCSPYEIYGGQSGVGADCLPLVLFLLSIIIPPNAPFPHQLPWGWYNGLICGLSIKGSSLTPQHY